MKLINSSFEIIEQQPGLEGIYKQIELAGRTCYKSEDKITEDSAKKFVDRMISSGHGTMLEHGTVYLKIPYYKSQEVSLGGQGGYVLTRYYCPDLYKYENNKYSKVFNYIINQSSWEENKGSICYVTTNFRVLIENNWLDDLQYLCEPTEYHAKRYTVRFICDRGVSHEFVRHRVFSFAQESTRYCNYSKDKFGNELTFIIPCWTKLESVDYSHADNSMNKWFSLTNAEKVFINSLHDIQSKYTHLTIGEKWTAQQARSILPNCLKTELVMTGFASDWKHFFSLRDDKQHAHPDAYTLAHPLHEEFIKRGYLNE